MLSKVGGRQSGCSTFYLVDFCSVLQAVVKWVSGETSSYTHHGQDTSEHGTQNQDLAQTRVTRHTGDTLTQRRQRFCLVQHSYINTDRLIKQSSKKDGVLSANHSPISCRFWTAVFTASRSGLSSTCERKSTAFKYIQESSFNGDVFIKIIVNNHCGYFSTLRFGLWILA